VNRTPRLTISMIGSREGAEMRVRLKGINSITKTLADGTKRTYWYAWKSGPALKGKPGSPEFIASFNAAVATKVQQPAGTLLSVLNAYQASQEFQGLAQVTRTNYIGFIKKIEQEFATFPLAALEDRRTRGIFLAWRDKLALASRRQADYAISVLALILAWALDRGLVTANPCQRLGRVYRATRRDRVWSDDDEARFLAVAPEHLHLAFKLAACTGQRQGDLLRLPWSAYDGTHIRVRQQKTGARVVVPVAAELKVALDATPRRSTIILTTAEGTPWTGAGFRKSWTTARHRAGLTGLTFHDLRGTAVTRLALAGCTEAEIASISGHSLRDIRSILDAHYLHRDPGLAESAIRKLEKRTKGAKILPTVRPTDQ
jgi:integrase